MQRHEEKTVMADQIDNNEIGNKEMETPKRSVTRDQEKVEESALGTGRVRSLSSRLGGPRVPEGQWNRVTSFQLLLAVSVVVLIALGTWGAATATSGATDWLHAPGAGNAAAAASSASTSVSSPPKSQPPAKLATTPAATISLTLETGKMDGRPGWPKYIPADVTVAAHETVEIKITSYDNGTAPLLPAMISYDKVAGGIETVNGHRVTAVANNAIAHTFTVAALGLNAVVPAVTGNAKTVTVTFTFEVSKAGTYTWNCFAPCGTGANGMAGPMVTPGWMTGSFTVA